MAARHHSMTAAEWLCLLTLSVLWGGSFVFNGVAVRELPTFTVVFARVALAALILLTALRLAGVAPPRRPRVLGAFLVMGLLNNALPFSLIVWGQSHIAAGVAAILNATTPLFTVLIAHRLTADEKLSPSRAVGVLIGLAGVAVMVGLDAAGTLGREIAAQLACLAAAVSYALAGVFGRRFRRLGLTPAVTATGQLGASTLLLLPIWLAADRPWTLAVPSAATIGALVGLAALSTAVAYLLYFRLLATVGATNLLLVTLLIPVSATALGAVVLGEAIEPHHLLGLALVAAGLAAIDGRLWRYATARAAALCASGRP